MESCGKNEKTKEKELQETIKSIQGLANVLSLIGKKPITPQECLTEEEEREDQSQTNTPKKKPPIIKAYEQLEEIITDNNMISITLYQNKKTNDKLKQSTNDDKTSYQSIAIKNEGDPQNTQFHIIVCGLLFAIIGAHIGKFDSEEQKKLLAQFFYIVSLIHDIGKLSPPFYEGVISANRRLTPEEKEKLLPIHVMSALDYILILFQGKGIPEKFEEIIIAVAKLHHAIPDENSYPTKEQIKQISNPTYVDFLERVQEKIQEGYKILENKEEIGELIKKSFFGEVSREEQIKLTASLTLILSSLDRISAIQRGYQSDNNNQNNEIKLAIDRLPQKLPEWLKEIIFDATKRVIIEYK